MWKWSSGCQEGVQTLLAGTWGTCLPFRAAEIAAPVPLHNAVDGTPSCVTSQGEYVPLTVLLASQGSDKIVHVGWATGLTCPSWPRWPAGGRSLLPIPAFRRGHCSPTQWPKNHAAVTSPLVLRNVELRRCSIFIQRHCHSTHSSHCCMND